MSCQTTHQLRRLTQDYSGTPSGLFDWLICPPASTAHLLDRRIPDFTRNSIQVHKGRAYWAEYNLYLWHSFLITTDDGRCLEINETFEKELERWRYLRSRFSTLDPQQTVFIISNTQNNLETEVFNESESDQYHFTQTILDDLRQSLADYFNTSTDDINLEVITKEGRSSDLKESPSVTFLPLDRNEWKGSDKSWDRWWQQLN